MNNFFKITYEKDYLKYFIILFAVLLSFNVSNLNVKNILSIIIAFVLILILNYFNNINENKIQDRYKKIKKEIKFLENIYDNDFLDFYDKNKVFMQYDIYNFKKSILNLEQFIEVYNRISMNSHLKHYQFNILEQKMYLCLHHFKSIEFNIPINKKLIEYLKDEYKNLYNLFYKYMKKTIKNLDDDIHIFYKSPNLDLVHEYNKF